MLTPLGFWGAAAPSAAYELISTTTLSALTATVTFSGIPQDYKHLQLRVVSETNQGAVAHSIQMRFNGISTSSYAIHSLKGNGSTVSSTAASNRTSMEFLTSGDDVDAPGAHIMDLLDYSSSVKNKTARMMTAIHDATTARQVSLDSGLFLSTSPVTSISMTGSSFRIGSRFSLYGVRG